MSNVRILCFPSPEAARLPGAGPRGQAQKSHSTEKMDVLTSEQRSRCMAHNRGRNTHPELALRKALWATGLRYRISVKMTGKPDVVFLGSKVAVFVDGCFWHRCPEHFQWPKSNHDFWQSKIRRNVSRDIEVNTSLQNQGWLVLRFWEHEIRSDVFRVVSEISKAVALRRLGK